MMDDLKERRARGHQVIREMFGDQWQAAYEAGIAGTGFGSEAGRMALEFAFAETWGRPGLDRKSRSMVVIGALIAQGKPDELRNHIRAGLNNGITVDELEQIILQTAPYCGFPAVSQALEAAAVVLKERGLQVTTAKDRGNL
jgi:4-carboxymuconolactone decarboxylase